MSNKNQITCIVNDDDKFNAFLEELNKEYLTLEKSRSFSKQKKLNDIIVKIEDLKEYFEIKLCRNISEKKFERFKKDLDFQYDKFFDAFNNDLDLIRYIKEETKDFFYMKKIYQLCHVRGYLYDEKEVIKEQKEQNITRVQDIVSGDTIGYWKLMLFLDFFESFPKFFEPIYLEPMIRNKSNAIDMRDIKKYGIRDWYNYLTIILLNSVINYGDIHNTYNELRNNIAHSTFLVEDNELKYYKINNNKEKKIKEWMEDVIENIDIFQIVMILISTEFDIRLLKLSNNKDDNCFNEWMEFFKIYNDAWQNIEKKQL